MRRNMLSKEQQQRGRNYFVWKCECKDKTMRPRGRAISEGCGKWSTVSSKYRLKDLDIIKNSKGKAVEIMPTCNHCDRKKRLTKYLTNVFRFDDREEAIEHECRMNDLFVKGVDA